MLCLSYRHSTVVAPTAAPGEGQALWLNCGRMRITFKAINKILYLHIFEEQDAKPLWRNRLARTAVNRKVGGSSPPRGVARVFSLA